MSEKEIKLTPDMIAQLREEILDTIKAEFTIHGTLYKGRGGSWAIELYAGTLGSGIEVVGNAYIREDKVKQIKELIRIMDASKDELPEALTSDDELVREAAEYRMHDLERAEVNRR